MTSQTPKKDQLMGAGLEAEIVLYHYWQERERDSQVEDSLTHEPSASLQQNIDDHNIETSLKAVDDELLSTFGVDVDESQLVDTSGLAAKKVLSPRLRFLLQKRLYLKALYDAECKQKNQEEEKKKNKIIAFFLNAFNTGRKAGDIGKKVVDVFDDLWTALRRVEWVIEQFKKVIPLEYIPKVNPLLIATTSGIINPIEGILGLKSAYKAYRNKNVGQRHSRIAVGAAAFALGMAGGGLAISLALSAFDIAILGADFMPVLIPACLLVIYNLRLYRQAYTFHRAKQQEEEAKAAYEECLRENEDELNRLNQLSTKLTSEREKMQDIIVPIFKKIQSQKGLSDGEKIQYKKYKELLDKQDECDQSYFILQQRVRPLREEYQHCREKRLEAERKVAMSTIEVLGTTLAVLGMALGTAAIVGTASVASFGMVPLAIIITGVAIGFALKVLESVDGALHHKITNGIRNFFTNTWDKLFHKPKNTLECEPALAMSHNAGDKAKPYRSSTTDVYSSILQNRLAAGDQKQVTSISAGSARQVHAFGESKKITSDLWASPTLPESSIRVSEPKHNPNACCII